MKFDVIVADPPWGGWKDNLKMSAVKRGAQSNYHTMTLQEIKDVPVKDFISDDGAVLALWVPSSILQSGLDVMKVWGFELKQTWIWIKIKQDPFKEMKEFKKIDWNQINWDNFLSFGMGRLGRNVHEVVLVGTCGKIYKKLTNKSQRTVFFAINTKHSKKPELLQDKLDLMFSEEDIKKLELFGRRLRDGWVVIGNENPSTMGEDINISLAKLKLKV